MQLATFPVRKFWTVLSSLLLFQLVMVFQSCKKTVETSAAEETAASKKPGKPPSEPPPPPAFSFSCYNPAISGNFIAGSPTNATVTFNYSNSPGGSHNGYTSATVNGIMFTTPPGTLNVGSGNITYTASGTPTNAGQFSAIVGLSGYTVGCGFLINVYNPPASGPTADPGPAIGSTGVINFIYNGQSIAYKTVRAKDGRIWLQQNLGSTQVAIYNNDRAAHGDYFQWGRWDDGHQAPNSPIITGGPSLLNPSHISSGNPNFITGTTASTKWWGVGGLASDTWSGITATSTNGKDPCAALGAGWRLPTAAEWDNISIKEDLFGTIGAFQSNLKLPSSGYRGSLGNGDIGYYWTSSAADNSNAKVFFFNELYEAGVTPAQRAEGFSCRCIKN